ncbi:hypothetical protein [Cohnella sp. WQ 127256]|uniref:hypothetical protein n=1 Tax=Cohnella sp. WQ 127256 TaxID=2938790 RepID=UPI00211800DD|nr:hypothetical protein [Cohnella sp. WQ 127256]
MESRTERGQARRREFWKQILFTPKLLLTLLISVILYVLSLFLLMSPLDGAPYKDLVDGIIKINILTILIFVIVGFTNIKIIVIFVKSIIKILFTVWLVTIIQFSKLEQMEQNVWIVLSSFFFVYLEVLLEVNDFIFQVPSFQNRKITFLNDTLLKDYSIPTSITILAFINMALSFAIVDLLKAINI